MQESRQWCRLLARSFVALFGFQDTVNVDFHIAIVASIVFCYLFGRGVASCAHGVCIVLFGFGIKRAFGAHVLVCAMRRLTKVGVVLDFLLAKITNEGSAAARNLVATVALDKSLLASRALANHGRGDRFLDNQPPLGYFFLFYLVAA